MLDDGVRRRVAVRRPGLGVLEDGLGLPDRILAADGALLRQQLGALGDGLVVERLLVGHPLILPGPPHPGLVCHHRTPIVAAVTVRPASERNTKNGSAPVPASVIGVPPGVVGVGATHSRGTKPGSVVVVVRAVVAVVEERGGAVVADAGGAVVAVVVVATVVDVVVGSGVVTVVDVFGGWVVSVVGGGMIVLASTSHVATASAFIPTSVA